MTLALPVDQPAEQPRAPVPYAPQSGLQYPAVVQPGNGRAVAGLVLGITAIVFSSIGIQHANRGASHKGMAVAGLTCGISGGLLYVLIGIASLGVGFFI